MDDENEIEEELDEELDDEELLEDDELVDDEIEGEIDADAVVVDDEDEDEDGEVPKALRKRPGTPDDEDDDDGTIGEDDVEADLDTILKDRIAAGSDEDDEDEAEVEEKPEPGDTERVAAKTAEEFSCSTCFMIVHPRQFGRKDHLTCPEGYDPCPSIKEVAKRLKKTAKK